jgi:hypothetical protein
MIGIKYMVEFLIGFFLLPILIAIAFIPVLAYLGINNFEIIFYGPIVLKVLIAGVLLKFRKAIAIGIFGDIVWNFVRNII